MLLSNSNWGGARKGSGIPLSENERKGVKIYIKDITRRHSTYGIGKTFQKKLLN